MILEDLHVHTVYCDGKDTPEDIVKTAIEKGMNRIGFSGHSYTFFDNEYCMTKEGTKKYIEEINRLKQVYKDKIYILCGVEKDYYSDIETKDFDYVIGSVHYIKAGNKYLPVDENAEMSKKIIKNFFDGDVYSFIKEYYMTVSDVVNKTKADIIGHFDLISKFNEQERMFNENDPRYIKVYRQAIDSLVKYNKPFEINTGAISRGYRTQAYPSDEMLKYICKKGGCVILSSDSHSKETLLYGFEEYEKKARDIGFKI